MITKQCCSCKEFLPLTVEYFHRAGNRKDGLSTRCKICTKKYQHENHPKMVEAAYRWRDANPDKAKAAIKNWIGRNPDKVKAYHLTENSRQTSRNWKNANRDWVRKTNLQRKKDNPAQATAQEQRRRTRKLGNGGSYTADEWNALCELYNHFCLCCKEPKPLTVDHVIPISKGGRSDISNLQPLCRECNSSKGQRVIDYRT